MPPRMIDRENASLDLREAEAPEVVPREGLGRRVGKVFQILAMLCVLGLFALVTIKYSPFNPDRVPVGVNHPSVGKQLEVISLTPLYGEGGILDRSGVSGKVVLLNFWGTWCPPCRAEFPELVSLVRKFAHDSRFQFLSVSCAPPGADGDLEELRQSTQAFLLEQNASDVSIYADPDYLTRREVDRVAGFSVYPTTILLDEKGVIRAVWQGYWRGLDREIEESLRHVLAQYQASGEPPSS
ncbi:MAG TPA: TlpA disulfide reductase family protein, partial [Thermogutta sp.]|nr:TlpA disulfide reductase family protein [Thermogutta sp.]